MKKILTAVAPIVASWMPVSASLAVLFFGAVAAGQQPKTPSPAAVQPASFERSPRESAKVLRFGRREAHVGDMVEQALSLEMRMTTSLRQGNEVVERSRTAARNRQRRLVTTVEVAGGRATSVEVQFVEASKELTASDSGQAIDNPPEPSPVQGKSYRCRREPGEGGKLLVTDADGHIPPLDEYEIVAQSMEMVGRANPLAQFLAGRTITVGDTVALPKELAAQVFNLGERFGDVVRFDLTLEKGQDENGVRRAAFQAKVEAASNDSSQMRMQVEGPLIVELDSCRAVRSNLFGPIAMSESRGTYSTAYQLIGTGQLKMSVASVYHDAKP